MKEREVKEEGGSSENKNATTGDRLDPTDKVGKLTKGAKSEKYK